MGIRKIVWSAKATDRYLQILQWYQEERGEQFASKFFKGILDTIDTLAKMPSIGTLDEYRSTPKQKYYSFLSHPKYRIIYRYTTKTLYIVAIHATMMKHN
nr:type II toxin-antitoxin system RelE/ParE family toxin [uncultured Bacteroides sp.]